MAAPPIARAAALLVLAIALAGSMTLDWLPGTPDFDDEDADLSLWVSAWGWHELTPPLVAALVAIVVAVGWPTRGRRAAALVLSAVTLCIASLAVRAVGEGVDELVAGPAVGALLLALAVAVLGGPRGTRAELVVAAAGAGLLVLVAQHRFGWVPSSANESVYILRGYGASSYATVYQEGWHSASASAVACLAGATVGLGVLAARAGGLRRAHPWVERAGVTACLAAVALTMIGLTWWSSESDDVLDRLPGAWLVLGGLVAMAASIRWLWSTTLDLRMHQLGGAQTSPSRDLQSPPDDRP